MKNKKITVSLFIILIVLILVFFYSNRFIDDTQNPLTVQKHLPIVYLRIDESPVTITSKMKEDSKHVYGTIDEMHQSADHSVRCVGTFEIVLPEGYQSEFGSNIIPSGEVALEYIRGRGNSTWGVPKKPYKIKFDKKQELLGMGSCKEWGLLANASDKTMVNNAISMWLARQMGMEYVIKMVPVDVMMIGSISGQKNLGTYYLTELVDIGKNRVDIPKLKEEMTDQITGGYLLSLYWEDQDSDVPKSSVFKTEKSGIEWIHENPSFDSEELTLGQEKQRDYIRNYLNQIDDFIMSHDVIDKDVHKQIDSLMDLQSLADFWLLQEFLVNTDAFHTSSNYLYKKPNGKLYWGPLWDFDLIFFELNQDNPSMISGFQNKAVFAWTDRLLAYDPLFLELVQERWKVLNQKLEELLQEGGTLDQYQERLRISWNADYEIWGNILYDEPIDYDAEFEKLRQAINYRKQWFNEHIDQVGNVYFQVSFKVDGVTIKQEIVHGNSYIIEIPENPTKEGYLFKQWINQDTKKRINEEKVQSDITFVPEFVSFSEIGTSISLQFSSQEEWVPLDQEVYDKLLVAIDAPAHMDVLRKNIVWSSSHENVATVEEGRVFLHAVGETIITGSLFDGTSASYLLHVYDANQQVPQNRLIEGGKTYHYSIMENDSNLFKLDMWNQQDMTKAITREEFALLVVKLYERLSNQEAMLPAYHPFIDTDNEYALKAYTLRNFEWGNGKLVFSPIGSDEGTNGDYVGTWSRQGRS